MKNKVKIALCAPKIKLCVPEYNAKLCIECAKEAAASGADVVVFPELALTGATAGDLFFQDTLIKCAENALVEYINAVAELNVMSFIGLPISVNGNLYNSVAVVLSGELLGVCASGLATRHFSPASEKPIKILMAGKETELARGSVYENKSLGLKAFVKIGEDDAFSPQDDVNVMINPTAMTEYVGLMAERREFARDVSSFGVPFIMVGAGEGESGTDGIYAAPRLASVGGEIICEAQLFDNNTVYADVDLTTFVNTAKSDIQNETLRRFPFIPENEEERCEACRLAVEIQARSLAMRMERAYAKCSVIGVSGGLDSTLAVLVAAKAADILGRDRKSVIAITMPSFGTTERTKSNALALAEELGCSVRTINIKKSVNQHFIDIEHDKDKYDVVYENAQARERTQVLMDIANGEGGLVVGTGDLSELALGFATYNGDHMSMYCVNGSVPKTFMRAIIKNEADIAKAEDKERLSEVLYDVINTPVSPELLPLENGENKQHTETIVGPYELHDFFLYYTVKYGYSPKKLLGFACDLFTEYNKEDIRAYLEIFVRRFFSQQFKRSCLPDGPRVTEISMSPRGAWQMPSDASAEIWLREIKD